MDDWLHKAKLPVSTVAGFAALALILWLNAIFNRYLFNVVLALLATVPVLFLVARAALKAAHPAAAQPAE